MKKNSCIFLGILLSVLMNCQSDTNVAGDNYYPVKQGGNITLVESGELESSNAVQLVAPRRWNFTYQITEMPDEGTRISKGDTVIWFDTREIESQVDEYKKQLEKLYQNMKALRLENAQKMAELENSVKTYKIQKQIVANQLEQSKYNSDNAQKDAELDLKKTEIYLKTAVDNIEDQKTLNKNDEDKVQREIDQVSRELKQQQDMLSEMYCTSPKNGMVVYFKDRWTGEKTKVGSTVRPGQAILNLPDFGNMRVLIRLNEVDHPKVTVGQPARIVVEAYPDTTFTGKVSFISEIVNYDYSISYKKSYEVHIDIDHKEDFRLKPGLSVRVEIVTDIIEDSFEIPSWCLFGEIDNYYVVTNNNKSLPVSLVSLVPGKAIIKGNLSENTQLKANYSIPVY